MEKRTARLVQVLGSTFIGRGNSQHWITIDTLEKYGGADGAVRPKELLLLSLASCSATDVIIVLDKKRAGLKRLEMNVSADVKPGFPEVFSSIQMEYVFYGNGLVESDLMQAIELSHVKYCGVAAMLRPTVEITHSLRIVVE